MGITLRHASAAGILAAGLGLAPGARPPHRAPLRLEEVGADSTAFDVTATLVIGPTEVLLWDAQYHVSDAKRLADRVAATGKHLKAIVISHPDHDHYFGAAVLVERFPGTPVYLTPAALEEYQRTAAGALAAEKPRAKAEAPDSIVTARALPSNRLTVDGETVEVIPDLAGDVLRATNSVLWIPSLGTVLAADLAFNGVHPWLGSSDEASRAAWRQSLQRVAKLHPKAVVAGHKRDVSAPDSPDVLTFMDRYLADFDSLRKVSTTADAFFAAVRQKYPDLAVAGLARYSTRMALKPASGGQ
jgi:glyoxylase-like metal-dependent hydrolase (beta-lactamase superfamily II)